MRIPGFSRHALTSRAAAAMLAGCGGSQPPIVAPLRKSGTGGFQDRSSGARIGFTPDVVIQAPTSSTSTDPQFFFFAEVLKSMRVSSIAVVGLFAAIVTAFAGCSSGQQGAQSMPISTATAHGASRVQSHRYILGRTSTAVTYHILHSFSPNDIDGTGPTTSLLNVNGTGYGVTGGGTTGNGIVFTITRARHYNVLYNFQGSPDGAGPSGSLINVGGTLYGVTTGGGAYGLGSVFSITPSGNETVLYSFTGEPDGNEPSGALVSVNGTLYGTTRSGGTSVFDCNPGGCGTVFSVTQGGQEAILHRFTAGSDGFFPLGNLIFAHGKLYGTTFWGGAGSGSDCSPDGCGIIYSITTNGTTTSGVEQILHAFSGPPDGERPRAGLTNDNGTLYGTTTLGGLACECGTVFSVDASGNEAVVYSFAGSPNDGATPFASLLNVNGTLYGTTSYGGPYQCRGVNCGTVFAIAPSGSESIVHNFAGENISSQRDGALPTAALAGFNGAIYGTTSAGGEYPGCVVDGQKQVGCGEIFEIKQ